MNDTAALLAALICGGLTIAITVAVLLAHGT